jgi:hypothetical protein
MTLRSGGTKQISPDEQVAQAMLLLHSKDAIEALNMSSAVSGAVADVYDNNPDPSDEDIRQPALTAIQDLGYVIQDLDTIGAQYDLMKANHAGMWSGNYTIVDSARAVHSLLVDSSNIRLLLNGVEEVLNVPSDGGAFSAQKLVVDNEKVSVAFTFATTIDDVDLTAPSVDLATLAQHYQVLLSGKLTIKGDNVGPRDIKGKRGVSTPAGVYYDRGEEPPWVWAGQYQLRYTDTDNWDLYGSPLLISCDSKTHALNVQFGAQALSSLSYGSNVITGSLALTKGVPTRVTMEMHASAAGNRKCFIWLETTGQIRTLTGFATDPLDSVSLWGPPPSPTVRFTAAKERVRTRAVVSGIVDFFRTVYDSIFSATSLVGAATDASPCTPSTLFTGNTIKVKQSDGSTQNATGYQVNETGTQRIALYTYAAPATETNYFAARAKLKSYQQLDEAKQPQAGLENCLVGVLAATTFELPSLVEKNFYEVRLSLTDYNKIDTGGLSLDLAIDDAGQPGLFSLAQADAAKSSKDATTGEGPNADVIQQIPDFTKASVLVRGASGEAQEVGFKHYYLAVSPTTTGKGVTVTRTIYTPTSDGTAYVVAGTASTVSVPILMHVQIEMDSRDALDVSGTTWAPAFRGKNYDAAVTAMKGQPPYTWRILNDAKPKGLNWSSGINASGDSVGVASAGVSGTVDTEETPGTTYNPSIRLMSDKSCVMKPIVASLQILISEPDLIRKSAMDVTNSISTAIAGFTAIAAGLLTYLLWRKDVAREKKKAASDKSVPLKEMSVENLQKLGTVLEEAAKHGRELLKDKARYAKIKSTIEQADTSISKLQSQVDGLLKAIKDGRAEEKKFAGELQELKDGIAEMQREKESRALEKQKTDELEESSA